MRVGLDDYRVEFYKKVLTNGHEVAVEFDHVDKCVRISLSAGVENCALALAEGIAAATDIHFKRWRVPLTAGAIA